MPPDSRADSAARGVSSAGHVSCRPGRSTHSLGRSPARSAERREAADSGGAFQQPNVTGGQPVGRCCVGPAQLDGHAVRPVRPQGHREEGADVGQRRGTRVTAVRGAAGDQGQGSVHPPSINPLIHTKQV